MATYKVVDSEQLDADLKVVADAIRSKGGTTAELPFPDGMKGAVEAIESGGIQPDIVMKVGDTLELYLEDWEGAELYENDYYWNEDDSVATIEIYTSMAYVEAKSVGVTRVCNVDPFGNSTNGVGYFITIQVTESGSSSGGGTGGDDVSKYIAEQYAEVFLPNAKSIKPYAFCKDTTITHISMPKVTILGEYVFDGCINLTLTSLPEGLTSIGEYAFRDCQKITISSLPEGLTSISGYAFIGCKNITINRLPNGLSEINRYTFAYCDELAITSLPEGIKNIRAYGFSGCKKLTLTSLPEGLTSIAEYAFYNCTGLTSITFKSTPSINQNAFKNCTNLKVINVPWAEDTVAKAPWGATNATINYNYTGE